jgi:hypothetical protein
VSRSHYEQPLDWSSGERARFWEKVQKHGTPNQCWLWRGLICKVEGSEGRPQFMRHGSTRYHWANRVAWADVKGGVPAGSDVVRNCANRHCVNPAHHELRKEAETNESVQAA